MGVAILVLPWPLFAGESQTAGGSGECYRHAHRQLCHAPVRAQDGDGCLEGSLVRLGESNDWP